jgi:DNA-directed RNA polymerase specialized sigma24 family protein
METNEERRLGSAPALDWSHALLWLQRAARHAGGNRADCEDAAQEAAVRAWQAVGGGRSGEVRALDRLLAKKLRDATIDLARQRRRRERHERSAADVDPARTGEAAPAPTGCAANEAAMDSLVEQVAGPAFAGLARADLDLWLAARVEGHGWKAAGEAAGLDKAAVAGVWRRISRFLSAESAFGRLTQRRVLVSHRRRALHARVVRCPALSSARYIECDSIAPHRVCHGR